MEGGSPNIISTGFQQGGFIAGEPNPTNAVLKNAC
jgi:hypothetical protein